MEPDIIVTERGDYAERFIVIEVKAHAAALLDVEDDLRAYMVHNNFTLGMLIAPGTIRLYKNLYTGYGADSVTLLGAYPLPDFDSFARAPTGDRSSMANLEDAVQRWIERLPTPEALTHLAPALRQTLEVEFAPYVRIGEVRAAKHRRWPRLASDAARR